MLVSILRILYSRG